MQSGGSRISKRGGIHLFVEGGNHFFLITLDSKFKKGTLMPHGGLAHPWHYSPRRLCGNINFFKCEKFFLDYGKHVCNYLTFLEFSVFI